MTYDDFIRTYTGKTVDTDGYYGGQCMDLMHKYCLDVFGFPLSYLAAPAAKDVFLNFPNILGSNKFKQIKNTPTGVPQKGDIMFWGTGIGPYGHVAIFIEGDQNKFTSFDQNWNNVQVCNKISHDYTAVLGWLRPITSSQTETMDYKVKYEEEKKAHDTDNFNKDREIENLRKEVGTLQAKVDNAPAECEVQCQKVKDEVTSHLLAEFTTKENNYKQKIKELESQASTPAPAIEKPLYERYKGASVLSKLEACITIWKA